MRVVLRFGVWRELLGSEPTKIALFACSSLFCTDMAWTNLINPNRPMTKGMSWPVDFMSYMR